MSSDEGSLARVRELAQFWNWLPAFRAVAESEHLPPHDRLRYCVVFRKKDAMR